MRSVNTYNKSCITELLFLKVYGIYKSEMYCFLVRKPY